MSLVRSSIIAALGPGSESGVTKGKRHDMSVRFVLGRAGVGKTRWCVAGAVRALGEASERPLVLLVPEQATYQMERAVLGEGVKGFSRLRILSFERLGTMLHAGSAGRAELSRVGRQMIMGQVLEDCAGEFQLLRGEGDVSGLSARLGDFITELYHADARPEDLVRYGQALQKESPGSQTALKLFDLARVFGAYEEFMTAQGARLVDPDDTMRRVRQKIGQAESLRGMTLWVDGFSGFTVHELELLSEMLKAADDATIALCLDPGRIDPEADEMPAGEDLSLFEPTEETYYELRRICGALKLTVDEPIVLSEFHRYAQAPGLGAMEKVFGEEAGADQTKAKADGAIEVAALPDRRSECLRAARTIARAVREGACRYRDVAVVVPQMESYQNLLVWAFERLGVPYFLDRPRPLRQHPAAELIDTALHAAARYFALDDMTAYMKTGLTGLGDFELDLVDNYCRACGVEGGDWLLEKPWDFADANRCSFDLKRIDRCRRVVIAPLQRLREGLGIETGKAISAQGFVRALWEFLTELAVPAKLAAWAKADPSDQQYGHRQFMEKLTGMLDEMRVICGERERPAAQFIRQVQTAFACLTVKLIPAALDQVLIGSIERSRHPDIQRLFLLGVTQTDFPMPVTLDSLLSGEDRRALEPMEFGAAETLETQLLRRRYLAYIALTRSSRKLTLSYPILDENNNPVQAWSGLETIRDAFEDVRVEYPAATPRGFDEVLTRRELDGMVCRVLGRDSRANETQKETASALVDEFKGDASTGLWTKALMYENKAVLDGSLAGRLFADPLETSISRLQTFAACPYRYFAQYTLRLEKRRLVRLEAVDFGTFYHQVLDRLFRELHKERINWRAVESGVLGRRAVTTAQAVIAKDAALQSYIRHSKHHEYLLTGAVQQLERLVEAVRRSVCAGRFTPLATEAEYGFNQDGLEAICLCTETGRGVQVRGKIDRVDVMEQDGRTAAAVFDYKRSAKAMKWGHWYYGLDIQLPVYLMAIGGQTLEGVRIDETAGAFFYPIETSPESTALSRADAADEEIMYKAKGMFRGKFAEALDNEVNRWSQYYNMYVSNGDWTKLFGSTGALSEAQFEAVMRRTRETIGRLADEIGAGAIDITPYRIARMSPCSYCEYRAVCKFDWQVNEYNMLESLDKQGVIDRLEADDGD